MGYSIKGTVRCNMGCKYCYESTTRQVNKDAGEQVGYNVDKILEFIHDPKNNVRHAPNLHGGEPLLLPKEKNEQLLKAIYERFGETSIQTNATLIDEDYIRMFKQYKTKVGVSIDGHEELNMGRWMGTEDRTLKTADKILENLRWMKQEGIEIGIIIVVSRKNGAPDKVEKMKEFVLMMKEIGIRGGRMNLIELDYEDIREEYELSAEEAGHFYAEMAEFTLKHDLRYAPFTDAVNAMLGYSYDTCVTTQCDPYHTLGEQPLYGDGSVGNCLRTTKDGVVFLAETNMNGNARVSNERYSILRQIPQSEGGCGGCRFWNICNAYCPGSGDQQDWRNKTTSCGALQVMFGAIEQRLKTIMPALRLTTERHDIPDHQMFEEIRSSKANQRVVKSMMERQSAF